MCERKNVLVYTTTMVIVATIRIVLNRMYTGTQLICKSCGSNRQHKCNGEVAIDFPGLHGLGKPIVWVFPQLLLCLDCGVADFQIRKEELRVLREHGQSK